MSHQKGSLLLVALIFAVVGILPLGLGALYIPISVPLNLLRFHPRAR
jgi:hypothetical protein